MTKFAVLIYIAAMVVANLLVAWLGKWWSPFNAFLLIGLDLTLRDFMHDRLSKLKMLGVIAAGGAITYVANPSAAHIAIASATAFAAAAVVDFIVYSYLRKRPWLVRSNGSNVAGAAVDSLIFPTLAFGSFLPHIVALQFFAKVGGGALWSWLLQKREFLWDEWRGNGKPAMWLKRLLFIKGFRLDAHKFVAADDADCFHTHPAYCVRVILKGGYVEEVLHDDPEYGGMQWRSFRTWRPGMIGLVKPAFAHRIEALRKGPSYSLWLRCPVIAKVKLLGAGWPKGAVTMSTEK